MNQFSAGADCGGVAPETIVAGGGPAGLTTAYELTKHRHPCVVLESDPHLVGGISRTDEYKGYRFDIGGHRFFSKSTEVTDMWREVLGDQLITRDADEPDLLQPQVLRLPPAGHQRPVEPRPLPLRPDPGQLHEGQGTADPARAELRGLGRQPVRSPALRDLLQDLHREGLGDAHQRDLGRLGRPADQGARPD